MRLPGRAVLLAILTLLTFAVDEELEVRGLFSC